MTAGENKICASSGERAGKLLAEAAAGSGDDGHAAGQIEESLRLV